MSFILGIIVGMVIYHVLFNQKRRQALWLCIQHMMDRDNPPINPKLPH
jgi:hypothetical protein